jgi:hypothetical protein
MKRVVVAVIVVMASLVAVAPAFADSAPSYPGLEHLHFHAGPYLVKPGANLILLQYNQVPKPTQDGYMVRFSPNLRYARANGTCCGTIPNVSVIHLHHGVWLSDGLAGAGEGQGTYGGMYPFAAVGEEKTIFTMPKGYGYPVGAHDSWVLNYMIHNLTPIAARVYITYDIDFVPISSRAAKTITAVHPIWMDVMSRHIYPVFNVARYGGRGGQYTFPDMASNPYAGYPSPLNEVTVTHPGTLIGTAGHLHPGGLWDQLDLLRQGASPGHGAVGGVVPGSVRLFRSNAHYFDKRGPISWNMSMGATAADWRPGVQAGDTLRISVTYDTRRASWYEVMGIMVVWEAYNDTTGVDPFTHKIDQTSHLTHGYYPDNNDNGGSFSIGLSIKHFPTCHVSKVQIKNFKYNPGDFTATGAQRCIPTITSGQAITFANADADQAPAGQADLGLGTLISPPSWYTKSIFHSITACQDPCGLNTGISYPLANGSGGFDSGQLGPATPAVGTLDWSTPTNLKPGTYTFYCRIHPFMRGVFRVIR